jgi:hypothetical protein
VDLEEVVRCSKRIITAARTFQLLSGGMNTTSCHHGSVGLPVCPVLFPADQAFLTDSALLYKKYAKFISKFIQTRVVGEFPGLSLHDRLAILVPGNKGDAFKKGLKPLLEEELAQLEVLGAKNCLKLVDAADSNRTLSAGERGRNIAIQKIIYDTIEAFDGLEKLIVIAVGMDAALSDDPECIARSQIYRALTRAHMLACITNVHVPGGWLEFLKLVTFDDKSVFDETKELAKFNYLAADELTLANGRVEDFLVDDM